MPEPTPIYSRTFDLPIGSLNLSPAYWQAVVFVLLIFLLIFSLARMRHLYVKWSFKGFMPAFLLGFLVAIVLEGFLIVSGKNVIIELIGLENMPKPISTFIEETRSELIKELGEEETCQPPKVESSINSVLDAIETLPEDQQNTVKVVVCQ